MITGVNGILNNSSELTLKLRQILNPAALLQKNKETQVKNQCIETIEQVYSSMPYLKDEPLLNPEVEWFTNDGSVIQDGVKGQVFHCQSSGNNRGKTFAPYYFVPPKLNL